MNIKVEKIVHDTMMEISSHLGSLVFTSLSKKIEAGKTYGVEFDINEDIQLGKNAQKADCYPQPAFHKNATNEIRCFVESIDEDGICLRLAVDCIIMAGYEDNKIQVGDCLLLNIHPDRLQMSIVGYLR